MYYRTFVWLANPGTFDNSQSGNLNSFKLGDKCVDIQFRLKGYGWKPLTTDQNLTIYHFGSYRCYYRAIGATDFTLFARVVTERASQDSENVYKDIAVTTGLIPEDNYEIKIVADKLTEYLSWTNGVVEGITLAGMFNFGSQTRQARPVQTRGNDPIAVVENVQVGVTPIPLFIFDSPRVIAEVAEYLVPGLPLFAVDLLSVVDIIEDSEAIVEINVFEAIGTLDDFDSFFAIINILTKFDNIDIDEDLQIGKTTIAPTENIDDLVIGEFVNVGDGTKVIFPDQSVNITEFVNFEFITLFQPGVGTDTIAVTESIQADPHQPAIPDPEIIAILEAIELEYESIFWIEPFTDFTTLPWAINVNAGTAEISPAGEAHLIIDTPAFLAGAEIISATHGVTDLNSIQIDMEMKLVNSGTSSPNAFWITLSSPSGQRVSVYLNQTGISFTNGFNTVTYPYTLPTGYFDIRVEVEGGPGGGNQGQARVYIDEVLIGAGPTAKVGPDGRVFLKCFGSTVSTEVQIRNATLQSFASTGQFDLFVADPGPDPGDTIGVSENVSITFDALFAHDFTVNDTATVAEDFEAERFGGEVAPYDEVSMQDILTQIFIFTEGTEIPLLVGEDIVIVDVDPPLLNIEKYAADGTSLTGWDIVVDGFGGSIVTQDDVFKIKKGGGTGANHLTKNLTDDAITLDNNGEHHHFMQWAMFWPTGDNNKHTDIQVVGAEAGSRLWGFNIAARRRTDGTIEIFSDENPISFPAFTVPDFNGASGFCEMRIEIDAGNAQTENAVKSIFRFYAFNELIFTGVIDVGGSGFDRKIKFGFITGSSALQVTEVQIKDIRAGAINLESQLRYVPIGEPIDIEEYTNFAIEASGLPLDMPLISEMISVVEDVTPFLPQPGSHFDLIGITEYADVFVTGSAEMYTGDFVTEKVYKHEGFTSAIADSFSVTSFIESLRDVEIKGGDLYVAGDSTVDKFNGISNSWNSELSGRKGWGITFIGSDLVTGRYNSNSQVTKLSGFTTTILDSFSSPASFVYGTHWDGTDLWVADVGGAKKIWKMNGFTGVIKDSFSTGFDPYAITGTGDGDAIIASGNENKYYKMQGFTGTIISSFTGPGSLASGVDWVTL